MLRGLLLHVYIHKKGPLDRSKVAHNSKGAEQPASSGSRGTTLTDQLCKGLSLRYKRGGTPPAGPTHSVC